MGKNKGETEPALSPGDDTFADTTDPGDVTSPATGDETVRSPMSPTTDTEHDGLMSVSLEQGVAPVPTTPTKECIPDISTSLRRSFSLKGSRRASFERNTARSKSKAVRGPK